MHRAARAVRREVATLRLCAARTSILLSLVGALSAVSVIGRGAKQVAVELACSSILTITT